MRIGITTVHAITDLKAYYDRKLLNLCWIVEELVGVNRRVIKLIMKVIPCIEYHICTGYSNSNQIYGGEQNQIRETGEGNITSSYGYRDSSCFNLKEIEKARKGTVFKVPRTKIRANRISIAFVDNTNHYSNDNNCQKNMKEIIYLY